MSKEASAERHKQLQSLVNDLNKKGKGRPLMARASEVTNPYMLRRPSGIMQLDIDTGGGLPAGGCSYISGPDNAGKTYLLWKYFAMQQRLFGRDCFLAYYPTESAPDLFFARKCGVKVTIPDEMIEQRERARKEQKLPPFTKDELKELRSQVGEFLIGRGDTGEEILDSLLTSYGSGLFNIIALDSVSAIEPAAAAEKEVSDGGGQQGGQATILGRFAKKFYPLITGLGGENKTTMIFTAQVRANRKKTEAPSYMAKWIDDYTTVGSYEMRHAKFLDLLISSGSFEKEKDASDTTGKKKIITGKEMRWKIVKGKAGTHDGISGETDIIYDDIGDDVRSIIPAGIRYGILSETKGKVILPDTTMLSPDDFVKHLRENPKVEMDFRNTILAAAGISCLYT